MAKPFSTNPIPGFPEDFEKQAKKIEEGLDPFSDTKEGIGQKPYYQTGARAFIRIGGRPIGVCQDFRWKVSYMPTPIHTIDTVQPWDIDVGPMTVSATLNQIIDPTRGPEADNLLPIMASAVHQPMVELQVLDKLGTSLFFARGMFLAVDGSISRGGLSTHSASFTGIAYQHYVAQQFKPYDSFGAALGGLVAGLSGLTSVFD
jgi:hypothetical protein